MYTASRRGDGIDPVAGMVLDNGVVVCIVEAVVALVAGDEEVQCVARGLDLVDGHLFHVDGVGSECCCHKDGAEDGFN